MRGTKIHTVVDYITTYILMDFAVILAIYRRT